MEYGPELALLLRTFNTVLQRHPLIITGGGVAAGVAFTLSLLARLLLMLAEPSFGCARREGGMADGKSIFGRGGTAAELPYPLNLPPAF